MTALDFDLDLCLDASYDGAVIDWDFEHMGELPSAITFTRGSSGLYINDSGLIASASTSVPRIGRATPGGRRGLLCEGARTNRMPRTTWEGGGSPPTGWTAAAGSGTVAESVFGTADGAIAYTFTSAASRNYLTQAFTTANNTTYCWGVRVEAVTGTVRFDELLNVTSLPSGCTITGYYIDGVASTAAASVTTGLLHLTIGGTYTGASTVFAIGCGCKSNSTGSVTLSRPRLEDATFPGMWIPTTTGTASRSADLAVHTLSAALATAFSSQGTMVVNFTLAGGASNLGGTRIAAAIYNVATTSRHRITNDGTSGAIYAETITTGSTQATVQVGTTQAVGTTLRAAYTWKNNDCQLSLNRTAGTRDTTTAGGMPAAELLGIGARTFGGAELFGVVHRLRLLTSHCATDAQLNGLTA